MEPVKIIMTGASGFVGTNLSIYLEDKDIEVNKLSLRSNKRDCNFNDVDVVVHLAGKAHDTKNTSEIAEYFKINTDLTIQLFDDFLNSDCKDFIYFSSVKAVADVVSEVLFENDLANPQTPYGKSKLEAEKYIVSKKIPDGKRVFIIRPCMIHGPGNKGNLNLLYKIVKKRIPYPLVAFKNERSFLSIANLNFLVHQIIVNKNIASGIYNFADDQYVSTNKLIEIISKGLSRKPSYLNIPEKIIVILAKVGDKLKMPLNTERLTKLTENYRVSNGKIKQQLQIVNLPVSAEEGLLQTIKSFEK